MCSRRLLTLGGSIAVTLLLAGSALAQLTKDEQKCIDQYNNKLRLVSATAGKDYRTCIKNAGKGTTGAEACLATDGPAKIAGKASKVTALFPATCTGAEPIQQGAATGNAAHTQGPLDLTHDILGDPVSDGTVVSPGKDEAKCQDKMVQRSAQAFTEIIKAHRSCKKNAMKLGTVIDSTTLDATCGTFAQIDSASKAAAKLTKLGSDVAAACATVNIAQVAPGECGSSVDATALGACLGVRAKCRACQTLNTADGQSMNCDQFDDNSVNGSCVVLGPAIGTHTCTLAPTSQLDIKGALMLPPLPATGAIDINCGGTNPFNGKANCSCSVKAPGFGGLNIAGLFWACVKPAISGSCPTGEIDCDGGNALGITMNGKRDITNEPAPPPPATACTGNADCTSQCATFCGGAANVFGGRGQCEGFCTDGAQAACTNDAQCGGLGQGSCNGPDGVGLGNICDCNCINDAAGGASPAGTLQCQLAFNLTVEQIPGNSMTCDGGDVTINVGDTCAPLTTQSSSSTLVNLNDGGTTIGPFNDTGVAANCVNLASSNTSGVSLVGSTIFYASTIGDLDTLLSVDCQ